MSRKTKQNTPGDTIRAVLRFRWGSEFEAVAVELHRTTFGRAAHRNRLVLRSRNHRQVLEEGEPYTLVELKGTVRETVGSGTYVCKYVRCLIPKRGWVTLFEEVRGATQD